MEENKNDFYRLREALNQGGMSQREARQLTKSLGPNLATISLLLAELLPNDKKAIEQCLPEIISLNKQFENLQKGDF
tara:strand:- start:57 stop:287 length:231 start_codon:yes stop_codon:yes gene_type:complete